MYFGPNKPTRNTHTLRVSKHQLRHILRTGLTQGPLITYGRNNFKWTGPLVGLAETFQLSMQIFGKILSNE